VASRRARLSSTVTYASSSRPSVGADFPIGCTVTVAVHQESDERLVAETSKRNRDND
jgi:hypothetical protein